MPNTISMPLSGGEKPKLCDAHIAKNSSWIAQGEETSVIMLFVWCFVPGVPFIFLVPVLRRYVERFIWHFKMSLFTRWHPPLNPSKIHEVSCILGFAWGAWCPRESSGRFLKRSQTHERCTPYKNRNWRWCTPRKINMEPKTAGLEDDFPFQLGDLNVLCLILEGVYHYITV